MLSKINVLYWHRCFHKELPIPFHYTRFIIVRENVLHTKKKVIVRTFYGTAVKIPLVLSVLPRK